MKELNSLIPILKNIEPIESSYNCELCKDEKYVVSDETDYDIQYDDSKLNPIYKKLCECERNKQNEIKFNRAIKKSNLNAIYEEIKTVTYETKFEWQKNYKRIADEFVTNEDNGLIISGQTGSGKSLLLGKTLGNLMHKGRECYYMQWGQDIKKLINQYNKVGEEEEKFFKYICNVDVLYIDDLFKTRGNDINDVIAKRHEIELFWQLMNHRIYRSEQKTLISTELFMSDFDKVDSSLRGRLLDLVKKGTWIQMDKKEDRDIRVKIYNKEF